MTCVAAFIVPNPAFGHIRKIVTPISVLRTGTVNSSFALINRGCVTGNCECQKAGRPPSLRIHWYPTVLPRYHLASFSLLTYRSNTLARHEFQQLPPPNQLPGWGVLNMAPDPCGQNLTRKPDPGAPESSPAGRSATPAPHNASRNDGRLPKRPGTQSAAPPPPRRSLSPVRGDLTLGM